VQSTTTREVGPDEVLVKVTHSGVCGTDIHHVHRDIALGHEGIGTLIEIGKDVKTLSIGDVVGWGFIQNSCGECIYCLSSFEQLCPKAEKFGVSNLDQGSFATHGVWKATFVFKIPDSISPALAAPLMCGGCTVFNVLSAFDVRPGSKVGVIGVGGLGHLAIQFASKMGCDVVVFSGSESKREEATKLGARTFVALKGKSEAEVQAVIGEKKVQHLIVTTSAPPDWPLYLSVMSPNSVIYPLTVNNGNLSLPYRMITRMQLRVQGNFVSSRKVMMEMLEFAGLNGVNAITEEFPMSTEGIEEAIERLNAGKMRYRGVLVAQ